MKVVCRSVFLSLLMLAGFFQVFGQSTGLTKEQEEAIYERLYAFKESSATNPEAEAAFFGEYEKDFEMFSDTLKRDFLRKRGWSNFRRSRFEEAQEDLQNSRALYVKTKSPLIGDIDMYLGHLYVSMDSMLLARNQYKTAIKNFQVIGDSIGLILANDGLANIWYNVEDNLDSTTFYLEMALSYADADTAGIHASVPMGNYAMVLFEQDRNEEAIVQLKKAMQYEIDAEDSFGLIFSYANLGKFQLETDEKAGRAYLDTAFTIAGQLGSTERMRDLHEGMAEIEEGFGNYEKALFHHQSYVKYKDELINEDLINRSKDWEISLENQKKDAEINLLEQTNAYEARQKRILIGVVIIILLLLIVMVRLFLQLKKSKSEITVQNQELEVLNATKDKFFSIIAHDLRSPMIGLQGVGQKLEYYIRKNKQQKLLEIGGQIDRSVDQLNHLLNNLLNWATSQSGGIPHHPTTHDLSELVQENIDLYDSLASTKGVEIINNTRSEQVYSDVNTTSTIIRNLLSNAIKFTKPESSITIDSGESTEGTWLKITDQGQGMNESLVTEIMDGTAYSSAKGTEGEAGFGLGLKLCKEFVEINRGRLEIESEEGDGTSIKATFPSAAEAVQREMKVA